MPFAETLTEACPFAPVTAVLPFGKVTPAPLAGDVNVTITSLAGPLPVAVTVTTRGTKDVLTVALCPEPLVAVTRVVIVTLLLPPQPTIGTAAIKTSAMKRLRRFIKGERHYTLKYTFGQSRFLRS